jgi:hypothetical protein
MPYLIDGHNLVAQFPGIRLSDPDDEARLVEVVRGFCARSHSKATIYFDRGFPDGGSSREGGSVAVHFVRPPRTADEAIRSHLARLRGEARNWTVVSSDREVRRAARRAGARLETSRDFARRLLASTNRRGAEKPERMPDPDEVTYWEKQFRRRG